MAILTHICQEFRSGDSDQEIRRQAG